MKIRLILSTILYLLVHVNSLYAQEYIALRTLPFYHDSSAFYIESVIDVRKQKHLGSHRNLQGEQVQLQLDKGATVAIKEFYSTSLSPVSADSLPVRIEIKELNVQKSKRRMNDGITMVARAHVYFTFQTKQQGKWVDVFSIQHNEDQVFPLGDKQKLYETHELRIRAALEYCFLAFVDNYEANDPAKLPYHFIVPDPSPSFDARLGQWFNIVAVKAIQSNFYQGYGISYTGFVDNKKGFIKPYELPFEVIWARSDIAEDNGYKNVNSFLFRPELYFVYKRIIPGLYGVLSANLVIGYEILEDFEEKSSFNFVGGAGLSQGIRVIPWKKNGFVLGADFFQQYETSEVYDFDLGVEVILGVNF